MPAMSCSISAALQRLLLRRSFSFCSAVCRGSENAVRERTAHMQHGSLAHSTAALLCSGDTRETRCWWATRTFSGAASELS